MDEVSVLQLLGQVSGTEAGEVFREFLRGSVRQMICEVMAAEVTELCGEKYSRWIGARPIIPRSVR